MRTTQHRTTKKVVSPILSQKDRQKIIDRVYGMWKHKRPDPIKELAKIRKEWDRT